MLVIVKSETETKYFLNLAKKATFSLELVMLQMVKLLRKGENSNSLPS